MKKKYRKYMRTHLTGHWLDGVFWGLCFGVTVGFLLFLMPAYALGILILFLFVYMTLEKRSHDKLKRFIRE